MPGYGEHEIRELATPLISSSQPAGVRQQVMSPTLGQGYGTTVQQPSPPPGRDGSQQVSGSTPTLATGGMGFEPMATGRALEGIDQAAWGLRRLRGNATGVDRQ